MTIRVLDPRQSAHGVALRMAPPLASLNGAVVGMIDNANRIQNRKYMDLYHIHHIDEQ